ncbi:unnamed protein product, partial [Effrenium voratum]
MRCLLLPVAMVAALAAGPAEFAEIFTMPGASFKLELTGPGLSHKDRALLRDSNSGCPGRSDAAASEKRKHSLSVASSVYNHGFYEPSPLVHGGGPTVASDNQPGWLKASWYPVQLRDRGSFRICYCASSEEVEFVQNSGIVLAPSESPCDLDAALYRYVGVAYSMGIKHSEEPIAACLVTDGSLGDCRLTIHSDRGGLSADDSAELVAGSREEICGEAQSSATLLPLIGNAFAFDFKVPPGTPLDGFATSSLDQGVQRLLKVCYCEKTGDSVCGSSDWQHAGALSLVGFGGSSVPEVRCYKGQRCRLGRADAYGMVQGRDAAVAVPGNASCSNVEALQMGTPATVTLLGSTAVVTLDVEYDGDVATVCYCSAAVHKIFSCQSGPGRVFDTLMGYVRSGGLNGGLRMDCVPTAAACPETPVLLTGNNAEVAGRGSLFIAELKYRPCEDLTAADVTEAMLVPEGADVRVQMPWPLGSGRYALCFCEGSIGCPGQSRQTASLQHVGELRVLGAIESVKLSEGVGFATVPLQVRIIEPATGIRCCARGGLQSCTDLVPATPSQLSYPGTYSFPLVHADPLALDGVLLNLSCAALGESGPCAQNGTLPGLASFPCRSFGPSLQLSAPPMDWRGSWRRPVGGALGTEPMALHGGLSVQMKAVLAGATCSEPNAPGIAGLPCKGSECTDLDFARGTVPGDFELCICESVAVPMSQICQGWHHLGALEVFGPLPLNSTVHGSAGELTEIQLGGRGFGTDSLVSVPLDSGSFDSATACIGDGRLLPVKSTVHSPSELSSSLLKFEVLLAEGLHALCWLPEGSGMLPHYLGYAEIFGERTVVDGCVVGPWQLLIPCSAACGAGKEVWRRRVIGVADPSATCSDIEEERFCKEPACDAQVHDWRTNPERPMPVEPFELQLTGANLTNDLHGVLVIPGDATFTAPASQGLCHHGAKAVAHARCSALADGGKVCGFHGVAAGSYELCLCYTEGPWCNAFLPPLGTLEIGWQDAAAESASVAAAVGITISVLLLLCIVPLVACPGLRRKLWKRLRRRLGFSDSKISAVPAMKEEAVEKEEDAQEEDPPRLVSKMQPEEEPPEDAPLPPEVPEDKPPGILDTEDDTEATSPVDPSSKSRKERRRERREEKRKAKEEKRRALSPPAVPPPPGRSPPGTLPALPFHPSFCSDKSQALEAIAKATAVLQASTLPQDGKEKEGLSAYGRSMKKLSAAMLGTDAEALDAALREAEAAGVGQELLQRARQRWKELGEKEREEKDQEQETMKKAADDLLQAVHETDIDSLQQKLAAAEAASVAPELLEQGRRRLSQLLEQLKAEQKRKEAEEALLAAMAAEIIGPLEMAVARAEAADVNHEVLSSARDLLQRLIAKEEAAQAAQEAAERAAQALRLAMEGSNVEDLKHTLAAAEAASVPGDLLEQGRRRLSQLLEQLKAEQKRKEAEEALQAAMVAETVGPLEMAIARAEAADVNREVLSSARDLLQRLIAKEEAAQAAQEAAERAAQALRLAMERSNVEDLQHALAAAEAASVPGDLLEQGRFRLSQLLEQLKAEQKRKEAEEALQAAMAAETVGPLEMAIARAEAADVNHEVLSSARDLLQRLIAKEEAAQAAQEAAERAAQALRLAMERSNVEDLKHALAAAEAASVPGDLLEQGRCRLSQLLEQLKAEQKRKAAEEALQAAMAAETVGPLEMAIARAEAADVNREVLSSARDLLQRLIAREEAAQAAQEAAERAAQALRLAMERSNVEDLKHALAAAEAASVPGDLLEQGRCRLSQLLEQLKADQKRKAAEEALQAAMAAETVGPLEMAIARAEAADVNREVLSSARDLLQRLIAKEEAAQAAQEAAERAAQALRLAMERSNVEDLKHALAAAEAASVPGDLLEQGRCRLSQLLEQLKAEQKCKEAEEALQAAMAAETIGPLEMAIARAEAADVNHEVLSKACDLLQSLQAREEAVQALRLAMEGGNMEDLQHALAAAEAASVAPDLLEQGRRRLSQLLEQLKAEQKRKAAEEALQAAMAAEIIGPLEMAVARAEAADVKPEVVAAAEQLLWQLQEKEESAKASLLAVNELLACMKQNDLEALRAALGAARRAKVGWELLQQGEQRLGAMQAAKEAEERSEEATEALVAAMAGEDVEKLKDAIAAGRLARVDEALLQDAESSLPELRRGRRRENHEAELMEAIACGDIWALREAMALPCHNQDLLGQAQAALALAEARQGLAQAMHEARDARDAPALQGALKAAERAGVEADLLHMANERLHALARDIHDADDRPRRPSLGPAERMANMLSRSSENDLAFSMSQHKEKMPLGPGGKSEKK